MPVSGEIGHLLSTIKLAKGWDNSRRTVGVFRARSPLVGYGLQRATISFGKWPKGLESRNPLAVFRKFLNRLEPGEQIVGVLGWSGHTMGNASF